MASSRDEAESHFTDIPAPSSANFERHATDGCTLCLPSHPSPRTPPPWLISTSYLRISLFYFVLREINCTVFAIWVGAFLFFDCLSAFLHPGDIPFRSFASAFSSLIERNGTSDPPPSNRRLFFQTILGFFPFGERVGNTSDSRMSNCLSSSA